MYQHHFSVILVRTSHPGNIGACARAMKTMGIEDLRLVNTTSEKDEIAYRRSSGAEDVLFKAQHYHKLEDAIADCDFVWGTSARIRGNKGPESCSLIKIPKIVESFSTKKRIGLVFGNEQNGLDNSEIGQCHRQIIVPTNPNFSSLNLASCVQLVCFMANQNVDTELNSGINRSAETATHGQIEALTQTLARVAFNKNLDKAESDTIKLRQIFFRMGLSKDEANFIHGALSRSTAAKNTTK